MRTLNMAQGYDRYEWWDVTPENNQVSNGTCWHDHVDDPLWLRR